MYQNNPMVTAPRASHFRPPAPLTPLIFLVLFAIGEFSAIPLDIVWEKFTSAWHGPLLMTLKYTVSNLVLPFGMCIAIIFLWVKFIERRPIRSLGFPKQTVLTTYLRGFGFAILLMSLYVVFALILGVYSLDHFRFNGFSFMVWLPVLITLPGWMLQGASEEILTRGWFFQAASKKHVLTGIILSSTLFAMLHLANNGITWLSWCNLVLYGLFAVFYALKTENLWAVCGFHSAWNWVQGNIFGIAVSGNDLLGGSLMSPGAAKGPDLLTGGAFGAEGSLIVSGLLIVSIIWVIIRKNAVSHPPTGA